MAVRRALQSGNRWVVIGVLTAFLVGVFVVQGVTGGVSDPTDPSTQMSHGAVVFTSALLVFREGLEAILVLAAVTASLMGANRSLRRPVGAGAALGMAATVATWFVVVAAIGSLGLGAHQVQAATGLLALIVLMVVLNWFFHRVYWTGWISTQNRTRRRLMDGTGAHAHRNLMLGLAGLGFASVYREGFEVVLFLQSLRLRYGTGTVLEGAAVAGVLIAAVGALTFLAHHRLPYKRMLVATGVLVGFVFVGMVGETVQEWQQAGWLQTTPLDVHIPGWIGTWFATFPTLQGLVFQALAVAFVVGSYLLAEEVRYRRPRRRGAVPGSRLDAPPDAAAAAYRAADRTAPA
jgi:high-affinity iron transporter